MDRDFAFLEIPGDKANGLVLGVSLCILHLIAYADVSQVMGARNGHQSGCKNWIINLGTMGLSGCPMRIF